MFALFSFIFRCIVSFLLPFVFVSFWKTQIFISYVKCNCFKLSLSPHKSAFDLTAMLTSPEPPPYSKKNIVCKSVTYFLK